jgi:hypoxanthine phosphoribosyltransferase
VTLPGVDRSNKKPQVRELSWAAFDQHIQALAREIRRSLRPEAVVGLAHGGVFVGGALAGALAVDFFPVRINRRSRDQGRLGASRLAGEMPKELKGRRVLVVDDVAASGETLELALGLARGVGAKALKTACLIQRKGSYAPDFAAFTTDEVVVFPWDYHLFVPEWLRPPETASGRKPRGAPPKRKARPVKRRGVH